MSKTSAKAVVQILVEVDLGSRWGEDCTVGQVQSQAAREASEALTRVLQEQRSMRTVRIASIQVSLEVA